MIAPNESSQDRIPSPSPSLFGAYWGRLRDPNHHAAAAVFMQLERMAEKGPKNPVVSELVQRLMAELASGDALGKRQAAMALGSLGKSARRAVPGLLATLNDADPAVRWSAGLALCAIRWLEKPPQVLLDALDGTDVIRKKWALIALGGTLALWPEAVNRIVRCLKDPDEGVRIFAGDALAGIVKNPCRIEDCLVHAFAGEAPEIRLAAAEAVWGAWPGSLEGVAIVLLLLDAPGWDRLFGEWPPDGAAATRAIRHVVLAALGCPCFDPNAEPLLRQLLACFRCGDCHGRQ